MLYVIAIDNLSSCTKRKKKEQSVLLNLRKLKKTMLTWPYVLFSFVSLLTFHNRKDHNVSLKDINARRDNWIDQGQDNENGNDSFVRQCQLANEYEISISSVANILHRREEFFVDYSSNSNKGIKSKLKDETGRTQQRAKQIPIINCKTVDHQEYVFLRRYFIK